MATEKKTAANAKQTRAVLAPTAALPVDVSKDEKVDVIVPAAFTLTRDSGEPIAYPQGMYQMPASDAKHWYAKAMGVQVKGSE